MKSIIDWSASADHRTAVHEASHAVIGRVLDLPCGEASIVPDNDYLGYAEVHPPWVGWQRGYGRKAPVMEAFIVMSKSGAEAERQFIGGEAILDWQDEDTVREAYRNFRIKGRSYIGDEVEDAHEARMEERAERLVREYRIIIERVACALIKRRTLTGNDIDALMRSASPFGMLGKGPNDNAYQQPLATCAPRSRLDVACRRAILGWE